MHSRYAAHPASNSGPAIAQAQVGYISPGLDLEKYILDSYPSKQDNEAVRPFKIRCASCFKIQTLSSGPDQDICFSRA
jgi:hypothetical protein